MSRKGECIYKRDDGRWEARYIHHYENGRAKYRSVYAISYKEAKEKRGQTLEQELELELELELEQEQEMSPKISVTPAKGAERFQDLSDLWLTEVRRYVKESTYARYCRIVRVYLNPYLGHFPLMKLNQKNMKDFVWELRQYGGKRGMPLSPRTMGGLLCVLKCILKHGRENGYPCLDPSSFTSPSTTAKAVMTLTAEDRRDLEQSLLHDGKNEAPNRIHIGILFTLYTGVRIGELCGLRFEDIDFHSRTVTIRRTVERIPNHDENAAERTKLIISNPKTAHSARTIPLPSFLAQRILQSRTTDDAYLLTGTTKPTEPHQFYLRYKTVMKHLGLKKYTFHALRHTFATTCMASGFDAKSLSEILGHSNVSTTLSVYVHPTLDQKRKQMDLLNPDK